MDTSTTQGPQMAKDFEAFAAGGPVGARSDYQGVLAKWGASAAAPGARLLSSWRHAKAPSIPLWLAALARSKELAPDVAEAGSDLGAPRGCDPLMQAWRYAAFNGWAREAAMLFEAQAAQGPVQGGWPEVWEAVSEGCVAQESGWGQKAASWIDSLFGAKMAPGQSELFGKIGKAFDQGAPKGVSGAPQKGASGWEPLCAAAKEAWGPCRPEEAELAVAGHPEAKELALRMCEPDQAWAQAKLAAMLVGEGSPSAAEPLLGLESLMAAANPPGAPAMQGQGWAAAKAKARSWASAASRLAGMGARWPKGELDRACANGEWSKAYALALAGVPLEGGGEPPLWALAKARRSDPMRAALQQMAASSGSAPPADEQALDVAKALAGAGARATAPGPDGLGAYARLVADDEPSGGSWESLLIEALALGGSPKPKQSGMEQVQARGLAPLADFLKALGEREELDASAGEGHGRGGGSSRL